jgi:hypothetical protein
MRVAGVECPGLGMYSPSRNERVTRKLANIFHSAPGPLTNTHSIHRSYIACCTESNILNELLSFLFRLGFSGPTNRKGCRKLHGVQFNPRRPYIARLMESGSNPRYPRSEKIPLPRRFGQY